MTTPPTINISDEFAQSMTIHKNVGQELVVITVDKIHLCLIRHRDSLLARHEWLTPFALTISLVATLAASDFHDFMLSATTWRSLFEVGLALSGVWLLRALWRWWMHRAPDPIAAIIQTMKAESSKS